MLIFLWVLIGVVGRLMIHVPDATPLTSLCLLAPTVFSKRLSWLLILCILVLSDASLHYLLPYPIFGSWTLFTYSGWLGVICLGFIFANNPRFLNALLFSVYGSFLFWIWTNFGTWLTTQLYRHTPAGLLHCYVAALPFLQNSLAGSLIFTGILFFLCRHTIQWHIPHSARNSIHTLKRVREPH